MNDSAIRHLVCPRTLDPLRPVPESGADSAQNNSLVSTRGARYRMDQGVPDFIGDEASDSQTIRSFRQIWSQHSYYREHTRRFYTEWYLQRYGFLDQKGLRGFLTDKEFILDAGTGSGRDTLNFAELSSALSWLWIAMILKGQLLPSCSRSHPITASISGGRTM